MVYRTSATVDPNEIPVLYEADLAKASVRVFNGNHVDTSKRLSDKQILKLYKKILKIIHEHAERGKTELFWSNRKFWGPWTVSHATAIELSRLLTEAKFVAKPSESGLDDEQYYISIYWKDK